MFPPSTVFISALTFCHFQHLSSLRPDKVIRLHHEAPGATVEREFLLYFVNAHAKASTTPSTFPAKEQNILALWLKFFTRSKDHDANYGNKIGQVKDN